MKETSTLFQKRVLFACATILCLLFVCMFVCIKPSCAFAKDYSVTDVDIKANVKDDASLHVTETRTFDFDGSFTCVWWTFESLPENASLQFNGVSVKFPNLSDPWQKLNEVSFQKQWRDEGGPGGFAYSVDSEKNTIYVFFDAEDTEMQVKLNLTYKNAVQVYDDTAELYWQYVGPAWQVDSQDVHMRLTLPNPSGTSFELGGDVKAWGHGNLIGSLEAGENNSIIYDTGTVDSGDFAEARILFPVSWVKNAPAVVLNAHQGKNRIDEVVSEETTYANEANAQREKARMFIYSSTALFVMLVIAAFIIYRRFGVEYKPEFEGEYWRDDPQPNANPVVVGRDWRMNKEDNNDFMTELMYLCDKGFVTIGYEDIEEKGIFRTKTKRSYYLERKFDAEQEDLDRVAKRCLYVLFDVIGEGQKRIYLDDITDYAQDNSESFKNEIEEWQALVSLATDKENYFDQRSFAWQNVTRALAFLSFALGIVVSASTDSAYPFAVSIIATIIIFLISLGVSKRTQHGTNVNAKCEALKKWLEDFTALDESIPTDVKVWGKFMVYAHLFGVADEVVKKLKVSVPEVFEESTWDTFDIGRIPWYYFWYQRSRDSESALFSDILKSAFVDALSTALSQDSSGGGFGGGFSGGGGGGFGGGGGGAR